jgi:UDP-2-acetamido-2,6-beta-L-arabino-hexul-4-ose reductase
MRAAINVLVTGANGFIGRNLVLTLGREGAIETTGVDIDSTDEALKRALDICDIVIHLAGISRPSCEDEFEAGNVGSLATILSELTERKKHPLVVLSSSTQALLDNAYGRSKRRAEEMLLAYAAETGSSARIFRLPGVFGKWCRPDYNSVVATFCHNITRGLPIQITDPSREIELVHVDDVIVAFKSLVGGEATETAYVSVEPVFHVTLGHLASTLEAFRDTRKTLNQPDLSDPFLRRLYSTYMSYLPASGFSYAPELKSDARGALAELMKAKGYGQIFVSRTKPGVTRGNHYHDAKVEKFVVLEGEAVVRFRHMSTDEVAEYPVSGKEFSIIDIPPGWTHSLQNVGRGDMIVLFWSSEVFDAARTDTFPAKVVK